MSEAAAGGLSALAAELRAGDGLLGPTVRDPMGDPGAASDLSATVAAGPRAAGHEDDYATLVEAIREGYELHYGTPRVVRTEDADLALLAGDRLYALGLARLAALGDLEAVTELADVISLSAQVHAEGRPEVAESVWAAGAAAVAGRPAARHEADKAAWRAHAAEA